MVLPDWQRAILNEGELYRVGGAVRDEIAGVDTHDTDYLVSRVRPELVEAVLRRFGKIELVGKSFGVYKFRPHGTARTVDIAFPRRDRSLGPGHRDFVVDWDPDIGVEEDLGRRDFSINAIAQNVRDNSYVDPYGGRGDVEKRVLRMIFDRAFEEDPLRVLRGVRFACRFELSIEEKTAAAMKASAGSLDTLSAERVRDELDKILGQCDVPSGAFAAMLELGVLEEILPELSRGAGVTQNEYHPDDVFVHSIKTCDRAPRTNLPVRWASLLHDVGKVDMKQTVRDEKLGERVVFYGHQSVSAKTAVRVLRRLRFDNTFIDKCENLVKHHMFNYESGWKDATVRRFLRRVGEENVADLFALRKADAQSRDPEADVAYIDELAGRIREELEKKHTINTSDLAVNGRDVMDVFGVGAGPEVGNILSELLEAVLDAPEMNDRDRLLGWLRDKRAKTGK